MGYNNNNNYNDNDNDNDDDDDDDDDNDNDYDYDRDDHDDMISFNVSCTFILWSFCALVYKHVITLSHERALHS